MTATALGLSFLLAGVLAAGPISLWLARARWAHRSPRPAILLWQALCLAAGLSLIGGPLVIAVAPLGDHLPEALLTAAQDAFDGTAWAGWSTVRILAAASAFLVAGVLSVSLALTLWRTLRKRRAHRQLVDLLSATDQERPGVRVMTHPGALAYTLPGWHSRVVLSAGLLELLDADELSAVLAHERAHLRLRDDWVQLPFRTWSAALGRLPGVQDGRRAVAELSEMLADDVAARSCRREVLASALAKVALAAAEAGQPAPAVDSVIGPVDGGEAGPAVTRVRRLLSPAEPHWATGFLATLAAVLLLAVPTALLFVGWR